MNGERTHQGVSASTPPNGVQCKPVSDITPRLIREPLKLKGLLDNYESFNITPVLGTEFPKAKLAEWMRMSNSDELIQELATTISKRGVVFFRSQCDLTDEMQKELAQKLGELTGKPSSSTLHIHPLVNSATHHDNHVNVISTDRKVSPAEDLFKNHAERPLGPRGGWHTDIGYEPNPADYTILKVVKLPQTGGDTLWASSCAILEKISPSYIRFLETLDATFAQSRYPKTAADGGFNVYDRPRGSPENVGTSLTTTHPVIRTNPVTGWKSLFAVGNHMARIRGVTSSESSRLHDWFLSLIVENHDCQLRHRWESPYDMAIWDNRSVFHSATMDFAGLGPRTAHRVVGIGEKPYYDPASLTRSEALAAEAKAIAKDV